MNIDKVRDVHNQLEAIYMNAIVLEGLSAVMHDSMAEGALGGTGYYTAAMYGLADMATTLQQDIEQVIKDLHMWIVENKNAPATDQSTQGASN